MSGSQITVVGQGASQDSAASDPGAVCITLTLPSGQQTSATFSAPFRIGRDADCEIHLPDELVSRQHAEVYHDGSRWWIRDLGSSNGTFIDGRRIEAETPLPVRARLQFDVEGPSVSMQLVDACGQGQAAEGASETPTVLSGTHKQIPREAESLTATWRDPEGQICSERFAARFRIGRSESCEISVDHDVVSRQHVEVYFDGARWCAKDLGSSNGLYVSGSRVEHAVLSDSATLQIGADGPEVWLQSQHASSEAPAGPPVSLNAVVDRYFDDSSDEPAGEHTMLVRRAFKQVKREHSRRYHYIIATIAVLLVVAVGVVVHQQAQLAETRALAVDLFYSMKGVQLQVARLEELVGASDETLAEEADSRRQELAALQTRYDSLLEELDVFGAGLSEEDRLILRVARLFGECELTMPDEFATEVKRYIAKWKTSDRLHQAIERIERGALAPAIYEAMVEQHLPPQFLYVALKESGFDPRAVGPSTRFGIAKGPWQFIPTTARRYGLRTGPLVELRRYDPADDRFDFERSTHAAAEYLRDIYNRDAQASGLLVMASYNWGPNNIRKRIRSMPENPRERNFWKLLEAHEVPTETYDYVFYIISAVVIGENPALFGFDFDNPLRDLGETAEPGPGQSAVTVGG